LDANPPANIANMKLANPILIYGELLRFGHDDRVRETANLFLNDS